MQQKASQDAALQSANSSAFRYTDSCPKLRRYSVGSSSTIHVLQGGYTSSSSRMVQERCRGKLRSDDIFEVK